VYKGLFSIPLLHLLPLNFLIIITITDMRQYLHCCLICISLLLMMLSNFSYICLLF
jgi:hypothetical protein